MSVRRVAAHQGIAEGDMILVRIVFQAKFGKGGALAQQMASGGRPPGGERWRLLTDLSSGPFDTVVMELEMPWRIGWDDTTVNQNGVQFFRTITNGGPRYWSRSTPWSSPVVRPA